MIATIGTWAFGFVVITIVCYAAAVVIVRLLDPIIGYSPEREGAGVSFPAELLEDGHVVRRPPVAVGPGRRRVTLHQVAHPQEVSR